MSVKEYTIIGRRKHDPLAVAASDDLVLGAQRSVSIRELSTVDRLSPYCIDPLRGSVVLVEMSEDKAPSDAAFLYQTQLRDARRVFFVDIDAFNRMCDELPDPQRLLFIHSTGRCGSTLLTRALNEIPGVEAISEPDVFTQTAMARPALDPALRAALTRTFRSCLRLLCLARRELHAIKFRSIVVSQSDLLAEAMPHAHHLFMYRNAVDVAASTARILRRDPGQWTLTPAEIHGWSPLAPGLAAIPSPVRGYDLLASLWAIPVLTYLQGRADASSRWMGAVRYEGMITARERSIAAILRACGLDEGMAEHAIAAFASDSQRGTALARGELARDDDLQRKLSTPGFAQAITDALRRVAPELSPEMIISGTLN